MITNAKNKPCLEKLSKKFKTCMPCGAEIALQL